jgi:hypothetical protein
MPLVFFGVNLANMLPYLINLFKFFHLTILVVGLNEICCKEGKIWLQQNLTDQNPAEELVKKGVPRTDIILGLQAPYKRAYTDYGVA